MEEWIAYALLFVISLVIIAVVVFIYYRKNNPKKKKRLGRENKSHLAINPARNFARSNSFKFISPANIKRGDKTANLDAVIIGYFGVLGIKALGYNGEIYGGVNEKSWLQVSDDGSRENFENPITESASDVRVIRDALIQAKLRQVPVEIMCVFTDSTAQLALPRGTGHYTLKEFKTQLGKEKYLEDTGLDLEAVENAIKSSLSE